MVLHRQGVHPVGYYGYRNPIRLQKPTLRGVRGSSLSAALALLQAAEAMQKPGASLIQTIIIVDIVKPRVRRQML